MAAESLSRGALYLMAERVMLRAAIHLRRERQIRLSSGDGITAAIGSAPAHCIHARSSRWERHLESTSRGGFVWPSSDEVAAEVVAVSPKPGVFASAVTKSAQRNEASLTEDERYALFWGHVFACFFPDYWY